MYLTKNTIKSLLDKKTDPTFQYILMDNIHHVINLDLKPYISFDDEKYKNNLVFKNKDIQIELICWLKNQETKFHNHPQNGCLFVTLLGSFEEIYKDEMNYIYPFDVNYRRKNDIHKLKALETSICLHFCSPSY